MNRNPLIILTACLVIAGIADAQVLIDPGALTHTEDFDGVDVSDDVATAGTGNPILWDGAASLTTWQNDVTYPGWTRQIAVGGFSNRTDKDFVGEFKGGTIRFGNMGNGVDGDMSLDTGPSTDRALGVVMPSADGSA